MHADVMDIPAAAEMLSVSESTLGRAIRAGEIPAWRLGKKWRMWRPAVLRAVVGEVALVQHPLIPEGDPEVVDRTTAARLLGITPYTCALLIQDGTIPSQRIGSNYRIWWPAVRQLMIDGTATQAAQPAEAETGPH